MKVAIVTEFYPRAHDPVLGVWAHHQTVAARDAGADVRVIVLHRPIPPLSTALRDVPGTLRTLASHPQAATLDGIDVEYVRFLAPPRPTSYGSWGAWAAPPLAVALRRLRRSFPFDLVHAHNAVPAADAVVRSRLGVPLVVSVHGADVFYTAVKHRAGARAARRAYQHARLVLANSGGIEHAARELGARNTRVLHLGTHIPDVAPPRVGPPLLVTVAHLVGRKRHADVIRALWLLREHRPDLQYLIIGDGPEREPLERLVAELGLGDRVEFAGQLPHEQAMRRAREASLFVMPSIDEAFGVVYVEAMAASLPAIGARGEPGPQEIAALGDGLRLVPPGDVEALAGELDALIGEPRYLQDLGTRARATVLEHFTWEACGAATVRAYEDALR